MGIKFHITPKKNYSLAQFDILESDKNIWQDFLKNLKTTSLQINYHHWQIVTQKGKSFARITFSGNYDMCLQLYQKFKKYNTERFIINVKSDFDTTLSNSKSDRYFELESQSDYLNTENWEQENFRFEDNEYQGIYEDDRWSDYGYMNDISNPFEVY